MAHRHSVYESFLGVSAYEIDAATVRSSALSKARSAAAGQSREEPWEWLKSYVCVPQREFDLLPLHFLPESQNALSRGLSAGQLTDLCVASKLLYAQIRWLDSIVDNHQKTLDIHNLHNVNSALEQLINTAFREALDGEATEFFATLVGLYSSYSLTAVLDSHATMRLDESVTVESYASHAKARTAPMRAPVDAVLMASGADQNLMNSAREAFENCMVAIQFYDDCLDVEEDFAAQRGSWLVRRIVSERKRVASLAGKADTTSSPTADDFYAGALHDGHIDDALSTSLQYFYAARSISEQAFPGWAQIQSKLIQRVQSLRNEYRDIVAYHNK